MKVVVTSDQHLGYQNCDKGAFDEFLSRLSQDHSVTDFVLLGDVVDMWRRDSSGVFLENHDTFEKLLTLQERMRVHYVAGNHDYHVLSLRNRSYPFNFLKDKILPDGDYKYRFMHGYEFDPSQKVPFMEALCRVMSDEAGDFESGAWATLTRAWSDLEYWLKSLLDKHAIRQEIEKLQLTPEVRLRETINMIESLACSSVKHGEILVFGHTHRPFINKSENVVNSGSWVKDAASANEPYNTYVELEAGKARLYVFNKGEIKDRVECPRRST